MDWAKKLNDAVLKFAREAIKSLTAEGSPSASVAVPARGALGAAVNSEAETTAPASAAIPTTAASPPPTAGVTPLTPVPTGTSGPILTTPEVVSKSEVVVPTATATAKAKAVLISSATSTNSAAKVNATAATTTAAATTKAAATKVPQYPLAFKEVLKLVEEGKDPPGIRKIPEQLSSDTQKFLGITNMQPRGAAPKPWEIQAGPEVEVLEGPQPDNEIARGV